MSRKNEKNLKNLKSKTTYCVYFYVSALRPLMRQPVNTGLLPKKLMVTVDMIARTPGNWVYHCHVAGHITAGMSARWRVVPKR